MKITHKLLQSMTERLNSYILRPVRRDGRVLIVCSADARVGGYFLRETGADLGSGQSDVFYGSSKEMFAYLRGMEDAIDRLTSLGKA